jgi:hypothetical protein
MLSYASYGVTHRRVRGIPMTLCPIRPAATSAFAQPRRWCGLTTNPFWVVSSRFRRAARRTARATGALGLPLRRLTGCQDKARLDYRPQSQPLVTKRKTPRPSSYPGYRSATPRRTKGGSDRLTTLPAIAPALGRRRNTATRSVSAAQEPTREKWCPWLALPRTLSGPSNLVARNRKRRTPAVGTPPRERGGSWSLLCYRTVSDTRLPWGAPIIWRGPTANPGVKPRGECMRTPGSPRPFIVVVASLATGRFVNTA